jgi:hypothetical protein
VKRVEVNMKEKFKEKNSVLNRSLLRMVFYEEVP